jgi:two-component system, chemotaxis family, protein-glutamate methylesterase/glutaminase
MGYELLVVGSSLGGLHALATVLAGLGDGFPLPIVIAQHREAGSDDLLCTLLQRSCSLPVGSPEDKDEITAGRVYIAPPDYHLLIDEGRFALSTEGPVNSARPSIDVLFESAADAYGQGVIGVVLTGMSNDGALGAARIEARGGLVVVQDLETAEGKVMPRAAMAACGACQVLALAEIGPFLAATLRPAEGGIRGV